MVTKPVILYDNMSPQARKITKNREKDPEENQWAQKTQEDQKRNKNQKAKMLRKTESVNTRAQEDM